MNVTHQDTQLFHTLFLANIICKRAVWQSKKTYKILHYYIFLLSPLRHTAHLQMMVTKNNVLQSYVSLLNT